MTPEQASAIVAIIAAARPMERPDYAPPAEVPATAATHQRPPGGRQTTNPGRPKPARPIDLPAAAAAAASSSAAVGSAGENQGGAVENPPNIPNSETIPSAPPDNPGDDERYPPPATGDDPPAAERDAGARRVRRAKPRKAKPGDDELNMRLAFLPHTDLGNAKRFAARHADALKWCEPIGWLWWDGKRWVREGATGKVQSAAQDTILAIQDEAAALAASAFNEVVKVKSPGKDSEETLRLSDYLSLHGRDSETNPKLNKLADQARNFCEVPASALDRDPWRINVANGTLVVTRKPHNGDGYIRLQAHDPADLMTKISPVAYDPAAACPLYDEFIAYVQPKPDNVRYLHQWGGLGLTGEIGDAKLTMFWGKGRNGKSTWLEATAHCAGDYAATIPVETFLNEGRGRNAGQATPDLAMLPGVRCLRTSEPDRGAKLAEALIKLVTGGDPIQARHLNLPYFQFFPQFKLTISGNFRPNIVGSDEGIWSRVILVPWIITVPIEKRDKRLGEKLKAEASGILNHMLDGLRDYLDNGLIIPDDAKTATAAYRESSDPLGRFLVSNVVAGVAGDRVQSAEVHELFCAWARCNGAAEWTSKGLTAALEERGYSRTHINGRALWLGVRLVKRVSDYLGNDGKPRHDAGGAASPYGDLSAEDRDALVF